MKKWLTTGSIHKIDGWIIPPVNIYIRFIAVSAYYCATRRLASLIAAS